LIILSIEWRITRKKNVENDSASPNVTLLIVLLLQDLWCNIEGRSHTRIHVLVGLEGSRKAKIDDLDLVLVRLEKEQVLWLKISVNYLLCMAVIDSLEQLLHDLCSYILIKVL